MALSRHVNPIVFIYKSGIINKHLEAVGISILLSPLYYVARQYHFLIPLVFFVIGLFFIKVIKEARLGINFFEKEILNIENSKGLIYIYKFLFIILHGYLVLNPLVLLLFGSIVLSDPFIKLQ